ncbi:MAG: hypothetical protein ACP5VS_17935 [Desulfomonilaceae bacterium]
MRERFIKSLLLVVSFAGLMGCSAVEPETKRGIDTGPHVREEDITESGTRNGINPSSQSGGSLGATGSGQSTTSSAPGISQESATGKTPRRFIWKDKK